MKVGTSLGKHAESANQIRPETAAHATVVHGDDVLGVVHRFGHKAVIDGYFSKFILDHGNFPRALLFQDVIDQGCLPSL